MTGAPQIGASATGGRRPLWWTAALVVLVFAAVTALRGRFPEMGPRGPRQPAESSPATLAGLLILAQRVHARHGHRAADQTSTDR